MRTQVNGLIENTQTQKKDLDEKLANGKKVLADNGLQTRLPWCDVLQCRKNIQ